MIIKADKHITQEVDIDILGITLLSAEEAETLPPDIRDIKKTWWLRSPGYGDNYASIMLEGFTAFTDIRDDSKIDVRPALEVGYERMCMTKPRLDRGDKINLAGHTWTVISYQYILCDDIIGKCAFRKDYNASDANDYEKSDVKKFLDDWFEKSIKKAS